MNPQESIAHYRIVSKLGEGGMGAVYRATDTKLNRDVAIKVLPEAFRRDTSRMRRFEREARVLASLNHPNIAAIYGIEEGAIVMELVDGQSPAGPLPLDTVIDYARQIATGLEAAHEKGVVHRDLKPANIKVTPDGVVKLLDFGLAKAREANESSAAGGGADPTMSPTLSLTATEAGTVLGTAAYMSPEQARGKTVDHRADIWAYGIILYELLTGRRPQRGGETVNDTLAAVILMEPDLSGLGPDTPPPLRRLIERCLRRDPRERLRDIGDARIFLDEPKEPSFTRAGRLGRWAPWAISALLLALVVATATRSRPAPSEGAGARFTFSVTEGAIPTSAPEAVPSPDGSAIVAVTFNRKLAKQLLGVRNLRSLAIRELEQTEGARRPFWSPDGASIGYFADGKLKSVSVATGVAKTLCDASAVGEGAAWGRDGNIVFAPGSGPLMQVSSAGGSATPVTSIDAASGELGHVWPVFLPGERILYLATNADASKNALYAQKLGEGRPRTPVMKNSQRAAFASPNYLLYTRDGTLFAQKLDLKTLHPQSETVRVAENVVDGDRRGASSFAVSENGVLVYRETSPPTTHQLAWYDRRGNRLKLVGPAGGFTFMRLSPDEKNVAVTGLSEGRKSSCLWLLGVESGGMQCLTPEVRAQAAIPAWSADSKSIAVALDGELYSVNIATGTSQVLSSETDVTYPYDCSPDGKYLVASPGGGGKPTILYLEGDRRVTSLFASRVAVRGLRFSPDSKWVAYFLNDSGQDQVYVAAFPSMDQKRQISTSGGRYPVWRRDGKELYFVTADSTLMAADIGTDRGIEVSVPKTLFKLNVTASMDQYEASADGRRFLVSDVLTDDPRREVTVVLNWSSELKK